MGFVFACPLRVWAGFVWPLSLSLAISACPLFCVQPALSRFLQVGGSFRFFFGGARFVSLHGYGCAVLVWLAPSLSPRVQGWPAVLPLLAAGGLWFRGSQFSGAFLGGVPSPVIRSVVWGFAWLWFPLGVGWFPGLFPPVSLLSWGFMYVSSLPCPGFGRRGVWEVGGFTGCVLLRPLPPSLGLPPLRFCLWFRPPSPRFPFFPASSRPPLLPFPGRVLGSPRHLGGERGG